MSLTTVSTMTVSTILTCNRKVRDELARAVWSAIVAALIFWLSPGALRAQTITFVQGNYATPQSPQTKVNVIFTAAEAAGDLNVVATGWNDGTATITAVTDTSGNVYTRAVGPTVISGVASQSIYYAKNIVAAAAGANTVTVTFSAAAAYPDIRILEYRGADPGNPVDVTAAASGNSATSSSGSVTTTNATDLLFAANLVLTITSGPGTGFTQRLLTSPDGDIAEDRMVTATGSYSATAPVSPSAQWIMQMVAFRAAAGGDTQPPTAPANLTATSAGTGQINLSWTASTDNVGVTSYLVESCQGTGCTTFAQIGASASPGYTSTGLAGGISYSYRVRATDAAGNLSGYSNISASIVPSGGTVSYVQGNYATPQSPQTKVNVTFTAAEAAGDLNVVAAGWNDGTATITAVTDTSGNVYTRAVGPTVISGVAVAVHLLRQEHRCGGGWGQHGHRHLLRRCGIPRYPDSRIQRRRSGQSGGCNGRHQRQ